MLFGHINCPPQAITLIQDGNTFSLQQSTPQQLLFTHANFILTASQELHRTSAPISVRDITMEGVSRMLNVLELLPIRK